MTHAPALRRALRGAAIAIAIAGTIDPATTVERQALPVVSVLAQPHLDATATDVRERLASVARVDTRLREDAAAVVSIGVPLDDRVPPAAKVYGVSVPSTVPDVSIRDVIVPSRVHAASLVTVRVIVEANGLAGRSSRVRLREGTVVVAEADTTWAARKQTVEVPLTFAASTPGVAQLRVEVAPAPGETRTDDIVADAGLRVSDEPYRVLVLEPRPSWQATFIRRSLEADPRFRVEQQTRVSRGLRVGSSTGPPSVNRSQAEASATAPGATRASTLLLQYAAIVVGAPEALTDTDVSALESFMRRRGGAVLLAPDVRLAGPVLRLLPAGGFDERLLNSPASAGPLRASEWLLARGRLPAEDIVASLDGRTAVLRTHHGPGVLLLAGALDSWRFRDAPGFDAFWRGWTAALAGSAPDAVVVEVPAVARTANPVRARILFRNDMLGRLAGVPIAAVISNGEERHQVRLWPSPRAGEMLADINGLREGRWTLDVTLGGQIVAREAVIIRDDMQPVRSEDRLAGASADPVLAVRARASGGAIVDAAQVDELAGHIRNHVKRPVVAEPHHPMRSVWWMMAFAAALAGEWWLRRRSGLR